MSDPNAARVRDALWDPVALCKALDLLDGATRQATGVTIRCPSHGGVSCSVTRGQDGTVRAKCFGCGFTADAIGLVGAARGLTAYRDQLEAAAAIAGVYLEDRREAPREQPRQAPQVTRPPVDATPREPPPQDEVRALWEAAGSVADDPEASGVLAFRAIDPEQVATLGLARVIQPGSALPRWARYQGASWLDTGHRMLLPVYDPQGEMLSVRAWRVRDGESPKRLPPGGYSAAGLTLANGPARDLLRSTGIPCRVIVVEGEPDLLTWATRTHDPVFGVLSGGWTRKHAERLPLGCEIVIRTHHDTAGDKYAREVADTFAGRALVKRGGLNGKQAA